MEPIQITNDIENSPIVTDPITLRRVIIDDLFKGFNGSRKWVRRLLEPVAWLPIHRFARVIASLDQIVASRGFREAMHAAVKVFAKATRQIDCKHVPQRGPLLVVSNHPGVCDSMVIAASLPRDDLKIVAFGFPLLRHLPNASRHLIFTDYAIAQAANMSVVRTVIRHLQSGGAVLIFPSGRIEPDPAVMPGALDSLQRWSPSMELILRKVPQTKIQFIAVSGVLSPNFLRHPLINLLSGSRDPQAIAETLQTLTQMIFAGWVRLKPTISFGIPKTMDDLRQRNETLYQAMIAEARQLLVTHIPGNGSYPVGDN